ncbi:MAG: hypothetical protein JZU67_03110 [Burkholderiaceae bacterium]|nr:hypothetical protein [Burkholderiaceae bacterium]
MEAGQIRKFADVHIGTKGVKDKAFLVVDDRETSVDILMDGVHYKKLSALFIVNCSEAFNETR